MAVTYSSILLDKIPQGENQQAQKSYTPTVLLADVANVPTLATTFQAISDKFSVGNNPSFGGKVFWTKGAGTTLTVRFKVSLDDGVLDPYEYAPSIGTPTTGTSAVDIAELTYASTTWIYTGSPSATVAYLPFELLLPRWRWVQVWAKSNNASGTCAGYVGAGRDS